MPKETTKKPAAKSKPKEAGSPASSEKKSTTSTSKKPAAAASKEATKETVKKKAPASEEKPAKKTATKKAPKEESGGGGTKKKKVVKKKAEKEEKKVVEKEEEEEEHYEQDFEEEEYQNDFEAEDGGENGKTQTVPKIDVGAAASVTDNSGAGPNAEARAAVQAVDEENIRIARAKANAAALATKSQQQQQQLQRQNFVPERRVVDLAVGKSISLSQQRVTRGKELKKMVQLDTTRLTELLDIAPMSQYELYMQRYGRSGARQAWVQTGSDDVDVSCQTEPPDIRTRACQFPDSGTASLREALLEETELLREYADSKVNAEDAAQSLVAKVASSVASERFPHFLTRAAEVTELLLDEASALAAGVQSTFPVSAKWALSLRRFAAPSYLFNRSVIDVHFSHMLPYTFVATYGPVQGEGFMKDRGFVCVWCTQDSEHPVHVLTFDGQPSCSCFAFDSPSVIVAGTCEGELILWDLQEADSLHETAKIGKQNLRLRKPTFSTDAQRKENHTAPITCIIPDSGEKFFAADERSTVSTWLAIHKARGKQNQSQHQQQQSQEGENSLGLSPYGTVSLVRTSLLDVNSSGGDLLLPESRTLDMSISQSEQEPYFLLSLDSGEVIRESSISGHSKLALFPRRYVSNQTAEGIATTCVATSSAAPGCFLAGYADGIVRLFSVDSEMPVSEWHGFGSSPVIRILWSPIRACLFFVFDSHSTMHIFDLSLKTQGPALSETFGKMGVSTGDSITSVDLNSQSLLIARSSGTIDLFTLSKQLAFPTDSDSTKFKSFINSI